MIDIFPPHIKWCINVLSNVLIMCWEKSKQMVILIHFWIYFSKDLFRILASELNEGWLYNWVYNFFFLLFPLVPRFYQRHTVSCGSPSFSCFFSSMPYFLRAGLDFTRLCWALRQLTAFLYKPSGSDVLYFYFIL